MNHERRLILQGAGTAVVVAMAAGAGLLKPVNVFAAGWNKAAFDARNLADVLAGIGASHAANSDQIKLVAPNIAENGGRVPIKVTSNIPDTEHIILVADKNPLPMLADFTLPKGTEGYISTTIKLAKTSNVRAIVKAGGKVYSATKQVKVTIGGCGG